MHEVTPTDDRWHLPTFVSRVGGLGLVTYHGTHPDPLVWLCPRRDCCICTTYALEFWKSHASSCHFSWRTLHLAFSFNSFMTERVSTENPSRPAVSTHPCTYWSWVGVIGRKGHLVSTCMKTSTLSPEDPCEVVIPRLAFSVTQSS